jgi:hypothetical protein
MIHKKKKLTDSGQGDGIEISRCRHHPLDLIGYPWRRESRFFHSGTYDAVELAGELLAVVVAPNKLTHGRAPARCSAASSQHASAKVTP